MISRTAVAWYVVITLIIGGLVGYGISKSSGGVSGQQNTANVSSASAENPDKQVALYTEMRKLWSDHVFWTREYMLDAVNGSPATNTAAARLMKNQEDIGSAVADFYGQDAGNQLTTMLKQHISIATEIVAAAKANDKAKLDDANARWQTNADQISTFLSAANPYWPKSTISDFMKMHLSTTADELNAVVAKQYDRSVSAFDTVFNHIMDMSDALSAGIIKQFPDKFK